MSAVFLSMIFVQSREINFHSSKVLVTGTRSKFIPGVCGFSHGNHMVLSLTKDKLPPSVSDHSEV